MISPSFQTHYGGAENQLKLLINHHINNKNKKFNIEVAVIKSNDNLDYKDIELHQGSNKYYPYIFLFQLLKIILKKKYHIIHSHTFDSPALLMSILSFIIKKKFIVKVTLDGKYSKIDNIQNSFFYKKFFKLMYKNIYFISLTESIKKKLLNIGIKKEKILSIPNGTYINYNLKYKEFKLVKYCCTGRLINRKKIFNLVKSFYSLNLDNSILDIYGEGPEKKKIIEFIKKNQIKNIKIRKVFKYEDLGNILSNYNVYISNSASEGMSNSILEAISNNLLVVCRKTEQNIEIIKSNNKFLFENEIQLKNILIMIENLKSNEINEEMKLQNKFVKRNLNISKIYDLIESNYLRLTDTTSD